MINSLSVIIPVHNEVQNIRINLSKIYDKLSKYDFDFEIIIIDSESKDGSSEELKKFEINKEEFTYNRHVLLNYWNKIKPKDS